MKKCIAVFLIVALAVSLCGCGKASASLKITPIYDVSKVTDNGRAITGSEPITVAANEYFSLSVIPEKGYFEVTDLRDGYVYSSSPRELLDKTDSSQVYYEAMSVLSIEYGDKLNRITSKASSYVDCVLKGGQRIYVADNGVTIIYEFSNIGITVPIVLKLDNNGIRAEVLAGQIEEKDNYIVTEITLLEYFSAGTSHDDGYIVVPDGSGAIIEFNNNKHLYPALSLPIYGKDAALNNEDTDRAKAYMPVFGIKNGEHGVLAIIEKGDAAATVKAGVSGSADTYNKVFASFTVRDSALVGVGTTSVGYSNSTFIIFDENKQAMNAVEVNYVLLSGEESSYSSMAKLYGKYLAEKKDASSDKRSLLYLNMICSVNVEHNILGVEYEKIVPTAPFADITKLVKKLCKKGVSSPMLRLEAWSKSDIRNELEKDMKPASQMGSENDFDALLSEVSKLGGSVYGGIDLFHIASSDKYSTRQLNRKKVLIYPISQNTLEYDKQEECINLLSPLKLNAAISKLTEKMPKGIGLSLNTEKDFLYSDFGENYSKRQQSEESIKLAYASLLKRGIRLGDIKPPAYLTEYIDSAFWLGGDFAHYDVEDYPVPFYQLAVSEKLGYSGEPINQAIDENTAFMRTLEYGGGVMYSLITDNADQVSVSDNTSLYNCEADKQLEDILAAYKTAEDFYASVGDQLVSHERLAKDVYLSKYSAKSAVFNYSDSEYIYGTLTVPPLEYRILEGGAGQ